MLKSENPQRILRFERKTVRKIAIFDKGLRKRETKEAKVGGSFTLARVLHEKYKFDHLVRQAKIGYNLNRRKVLIDRPSQTAK